MGAEPFCPQPASDDRTGSFPGDYCPTCGRPKPCGWHPRPRGSEEHRMMQGIAAARQHEIQTGLKW